MAAKEARGNDITNGMPARSGSRVHNRISDWLRDPDIEPAARPQARQSGSEPSQALSRLTASLERLRQPEPEPEIEAPSLTEVLERRLAVRRERERAEQEATQAPERDETPEDVASHPNPSLSLALAQIVARQRDLDSPVALAPEIEAEAQPDSPPAIAIEIVDEPIQVPAVESDHAATTGNRLRSFFARIDEKSAPEPEILSEPEAVEAVSATIDDAPIQEAPSPEVSIPQAPEREAPGSIGAMEQAVERLAAQFEKTATRSFDSLEKCLSEIMRTIQESRVLSVEAAEAAAARTIDESLGSLGSNLGNRIEEIAREIADLRADANVNERRTCDMLDAVRETLEHVAERLPQRVQPQGEEPEQNLGARARAAAQRAIDETASEPSNVTRPAAPAAPDRRRFIAAARRSATVERGADSAPHVEPSPRIAPEPNRARPSAQSGNPQRSPAKTRMRRNLAMGSIAATLLLCSYAGALKLLDTNLSGKQTARIGFDDPAKPSTDARFTTAESGAPKTYRPPVPATLDTPSVLASDFVNAPPAEMQPDPVNTGSVSRAKANISGLPPLPVEIGGTTLRNRAAAGDPAALFEVGMRFAEGRGVTRDQERAAELFERAAAAGLVPAQYRLGSMNEKGIGVTKDLQAARRFYEEAAASGNLQSMHNLGVLHAEGGFGKADIGAAAGWFRRAAEQGIKDSQFNLGVIHARGLLGTVNLPEAYMWFALAAAQGDKDAASKRDQLAGQLSAEDLVVAKQKASLWRPLPAIAAANEVPAPPGGWDGTTFGRASTVGTPL